MILCSDCTHYIKVSGRCDRSATEYVTTSPFEGGRQRRGRTLPELVDHVRGDEKRCGREARWFEPIDRAREVREVAFAIGVFLAVLAGALAIVVGAWRFVGWMAS